MTRCDTPSLSYAEEEGERVGRSKRGEGWEEGKEGGREYMRKNEVWREGETQEVRMKGREENDKED